MIAQKREKRRVRATGQMADVPIRISHLSETFLAPQCTYQPQFSEQVSEVPNPALTSMSSQHPIFVSIVDLSEEVSVPEHARCIFCYREGLNLCTSIPFSCQ